MCLEKLEGDVGRSCKVRADAERGCFGPVEDRKAVLQVSKRETKPCSGWVGSSWVEGGCIWGAAAGRLWRSLRSI